MPACSDCFIYIPVIYVDTCHCILKIENTIGYFYRVLEKRNIFLAILAFYTSLAVTKYKKMQQKNSVEE